MANDISSRVWKLDTAGSTLIWPSNAIIRFVEWNDSTGALGDTFVLTDGNGKTILSSTAQQAGDIQTFGLHLWVNGLKLTTLSSGFLLVHTM
jgi:hypothetical protein